VSSPELGIEAVFGHGALRGAAREGVEGRGMLTKGEVGRRGGKIWPATRNRGRGGLGLSTKRSGHAERGLRAGISVRCEGGARRAFYRAGAAR
jgi:hypothetical protein